MSRSGTSPRARILAPALLCGVVVLAMLLQTSASANGSGELRVTTSPVVDVEIRVDGQARNRTALAGLTLSAGEHTVCFSTVADHISPGCQTVTVTSGEVTTLVGRFEPAGWLEVDVSPADLGAAIVVDGETRDRDRVRVPVATGEHEVCFGAVTGYATPACEQVEVGTATVSEVTASFVPLHLASPGGDAVDGPATPPPPAVGPAPSEPAPATAPDDPPTVPPASAQPPAGFSDVTTDDVHAPGIAWLTQQGITSGCAVGRYCPSASVTRGQMATFLQRAGGLPDGPPHGFGDVPPDHPHGRGIAAIAAAGITSGVGDGRFDPNATLRRDQMATFLQRALQLPAGVRTFTDVPDGSPHAPAIGALAEAGITAGYGDGSFRPGAELSRGQMATFLERSYRDR